MLTDGRETNGREKEVNCVCLCGVLLPGENRQQFNKLDFSILEIACACGGPDSFSL